MKRGTYIALEGIEGAGKSTVAAALVDLIEAAGHEVAVVREPGGTPTGEMIRRILLEPGHEVAPWTEALLFSAARAQLAADVIEPQLEAGGWVVSDRSVYSSLAYQGAGRGLGIEAVRAINAPGLGATWPDVVALLDIDVDEGLERQSFPDRIGAAGRHFIAEVAAGFSTLALATPDRFVVVDATLPVDEVAAAIWKVVRDRDD